MLHFATKSEYFQALDSGLNQKIKETTPWHLKSIQDVLIANRLNGIRGKKIAEVGGGNSRLLEWLSASNEAYNIEPFEGAGQGPTKIIQFPGVTNIPCMIGDSGSVIKNESFDILFSISVYEHVPTEGIVAFIEDCWRILKPGGAMIHAIDMCLHDSTASNSTQYAFTRIYEYRKMFENNRFQPIGDITDFKSIEDITFKTNYASNPDNVMRQWSKILPDTRSTMESVQVVTLLCGGIKEE